jgi:hypothetical protein
MKNELIEMADMLEAKGEKFSACCGANVILNGTLCSDCKDATCEVLCEDDQELVDLARQTAVSNPLSETAYDLRERLQNALEEV